MKLRFSLFRPKAINFSRCQTAWIVVGSLAILSAGPASAATSTWDGGSGSNGNTATTANWAGDVAPVAGSALVFAGSTRLTPINTISTGTSFDSVTFSTNAGAFTLSGNAFYVATNITNSSSNTQTIQNTLGFVAGNHTITATSADILLSGVILGAGSIVKEGTGTLTLSGANTYSGNNTINAGNLAISHSNALGDTTGYTNIAGGDNGSSLSLSGGLSVAEVLRLSGRQGTNIDSAHIVNTSGNNTLSGTITATQGGGRYNIQSDAGTLTISGNFTADSNVLGDRYLQLAGAGNGIWSGLISNGSNATVNLNKKGAGTWTLSGANTYSGTTTVTAGTLAYGVSNAIDSGAVTVDGGTLNISTFSDTVGAVTLSSGTIAGTTGVLTGSSYAMTGTGTVSAILGGSSVNLTKTGAGTTTTLSGANTYSGTTTIQEGTLSIATINNSGAAGVLGNTTNAVVLGGDSTAGTLRYTGASATSDKNFDIATGGGAIQVDNSATTLTLNGQMWGPYAINVTKTGAGNLTLGGSDDNVSFGVSASAGTLVLAKTSNQYVHSVFALSVDGGTVKLGGTGGDQIWDGGSATVNSGTLDFNGTNEGFNQLAGSGGTILNNGASASTMTIWSGGDNYSGIIADGTNTMALVMGGANTLTLSGNNTYTGSTTVSNGTLAYGISNALASGSVTVNGGTLDIGTFSDTVGAVTLSSGTIAGTTGVLTGTSYALQGGTVTGNLGTGTTTVTTGTTTLNGTSGSLALNINSGTLALGASDRLANTATVTVAGGIFDTGTALTDTVGSFNMSSGSLTGTGTITAASYGLSGGTVTGNLGAGTTTVTTGTTTLNGTSGSLALNINSGTLVLGASDRLANTAAVTVAGGILNTGSALTDTVGSFNMSSGSLTGTGTITAASYGLSGGTVTGNLGAGTTTVTTGTTTLNGTSGSLALNVNSGTLALGASDRLANAATVTVAGGTLNTGTALTDTVFSFNMSSGSLTGTGTITAASYGLSGGTVTGNLGAGTTTVTTGTTILNGTSGSLALNINSGALSLGASNRLADTATVTVAGGVLDTGVYSDTVGAVTLSNNGLIFGTTGVLTGSSYAMTGAGQVYAILGGTNVNLTKTGAGTTTALIGANTYTGTTTVTSGTLAYGISNALASGAVTVNGGTLDIGTFSDTVGAVTLSSGTIAGTTGVLTGSSYAMQGGTVTGNLGAGTTTVTTGTTTLNGTSGSLALNINSGTLALGASDRLANTAAVTVAGGILNTGTALTDTVGSFNMSSGSLTGTGTITAASYGLSGGTVTGNLGAGTTTVTTGTTTLSGTSGSLALNINSGTLVLGASDRLANTAAVTVAGGILNTGTALTDTVGSFNMSSGSLTGTGTITAASYGLSGGTVTGNLGAGTTTVTTGTTTLNGTSGSLALNINSGTLALGASNRLANTAAVTVAGGVLNTGTFSDTVGAVTLSSGSITGTTGVLTGSSYTMSGTGAVSAILGGTGVNLTKTGAGTTTTLSAANTYTGTTTVSQGNLIIGNGSNAGSVAGSIVVNSGASLNFSRTGSLNIANVITGAGSVDFKGGATYNITAANTYSGGTNLNAGSSLNISEGGSLSGNISNLGSLSYSYTSGERTLATPMTGSGDVSYGGGATYNLTAAQTSTGATRIDSGIVKVSSTGSITGTSSVSVAAGSQFAYNSSTALVSTGGLTLAGTTLAPAVLGGSGVIGSALLVDSLGDTLAPGNSPGTLGFSTSQAWNSFTYNWQVQNFADGIAGIDYDQIAITGGLNLTGSNGSYVLDMESWTLPGGSGGASVRGVVGNLVDTRTSMTILTTTAGITGFDMANWTINHANFNTGAATLAGEYLLSVEGNNMVLTYVPEPDVALLGGIGFIILFRRRRS